MKPGNGEQRYFTAKARRTAYFWLKPKKHETQKQRKRHDLFHHPPVRGISPILLRAKRD